MWQKCDNVTLHAWLIYHVVTMNCKDRQERSSIFGTPSISAGSSRSSGIRLGIVSFREFWTDRLSVCQTTCCSVRTAFWLVDLIILQHRIYKSIQKTTSVDKNQFCLIHLYKMNFQRFRTLFHTATILYRRRSYTTILHDNPTRRSYTVFHENPQNRCSAQNRWTNYLFVRSWIWPSGSDPGSWAFLTILEIPSKA